MKQKETPKMWKEYRRIKLRLIILFLAWMPLGFLILKLSSLNHRLEPVSLLLFAYMGYIGFTLIQVMTYRCPNCDTSLFGRRLYPRTCPGCGIPINK